MNIMQKNKNRLKIFEGVILLIIVVVIGLLGWFVYSKHHKPYNPIQVAGTLKPQIAGLLDRQSMPTEQYRKVINGHVIQVSWADLQPTKDGPISINNAIDQAITQAQQLNSQDPSLHMQLKLRVYTGINAPNWVKTLDGAPVTMTDTNGRVDHGGTVGHFWTSNYMAAYQDLESKLAAKYDTVPELLEITVSGCTTVFEEPLLRQVSNRASVTALIDAGYTSSLDEQCQHNQLNAMKVWQHTHISMAFNPYQNINSNGKITIDEAFTESLMTYCRQTLGAQCVLENNSLRATSGNQNSPYDQMYIKMKTLGQPIMFQTGTKAQIGTLPGDLYKTLEFAISEGAKAVELPSGYQKTSSPTQLEMYDQRLEAN